VSTSSLVESLKATISPPHDPTFRIQTETLTTPPVRFRLPPMRTLAGPLPVPGGSTHLSLSLATLLIVVYQGLAVGVEAASQGGPVGGTRPPMAWIIGKRGEFLPSC